MFRLPIRNYTLSSILTHNKIKLVNFELSGTLIDSGNNSVKQTLIKSFKQVNKDISEQKIQEYIGLGVKETICKLLPNETKHLSPTIYNHYLKYQKDDIHQYIKLVDFNIFSFLKSLNIKVGITTSYPRVITDIILQDFQKYGIKVDVSSCFDEVSESKEMTVRNMKKTGIYLHKNVLNVDNTHWGILNGKKNNVNTIATVNTSAYVGLNDVDLILLKKNNKQEYNNLLKNAEKKLIQADHIIPDVSYLRNFILNYENQYL